MINDFKTIVECQTTGHETIVPLFVDMRKVEAIRLGADMPGADPDKVVLYTDSGESYILEDVDIDYVVRLWEGSI